MTKTRTKRWRALALAALLSFSLAACSRRSAPEAQAVNLAPPPEVAAQRPAEPSEPETPAPERLEQLESVTIQAPGAEEPLFQSQDSVLAQSIFDALFLQGEIGAESPQYPYEVTFRDSRGGERRLELSLELAGEGPALLREGEETWALPQADSCWLRNQLQGLA